MYELLHPLNILFLVRVFANGSGNQGSIPGQVIPKIQKMVLDAFLLNTQHYKVLQRKKLHPPLHLSVVAIRKGPFRSPLTMVVCVHSVT